METRRENSQGRAPKYGWEEVTSTKKRVKKTRRTFSTSWKKNVSIGAKWKECRTNLKKHKVVQLHQRLEKKLAGQGPRRGWCSTMERRRKKTSQEDGFKDQRNNLSRQRNLNTRRSAGGGTISHRRRRTTDGRLCKVEKRKRGYRGSGDQPQWIIKKVDCRNVKQGDSREKMQIGEQCWRRLASLLKVFQTEKEEL